MTQSAEEGTAINFEKLNQIVKQCNHQRFTQFIRRIMELKAAHEFKEYYMKISYLQFTKNKGTMVNMLQHPSLEDELLTLRADVAQALHDKYLLMFANGQTTKRVYPITGELANFELKDVRRAAETLSVNKAISWDLIPDTIITIALKDTNLLESIF